MEKILPTHVVQHGEHLRAPLYFLRLLALCFVVAFTLIGFSISTTPNHNVANVPLHAAEIQAKCRALKTKPGPPSNFYHRSVSDRYVEGTRPVLITNATIWTGRVQGREILKGDIYIDGGILKNVGRIDHALIGNNVEIIDVQGSFVTPGIVDLHSHMGVETSPALSGSSDGNSRRGPILPWLRSVDGLNTHDASYELAAAGGVTTSLILPGSANAIGGQAFVIKSRQTAERSPYSLLLEPPIELNGTVSGYDIPPRWKHMKHACGENPARFYDGTRMDTSWAFRQAYDKARKIKQLQDIYCEKALVNDWAGLGTYPEELQWEALVDVLRGHVKVQTHCYEAVDFDSFIRLTNEFRFPVAAFHHAHEAYLVTDLLKKAYEYPPAVAMFAAFSRYKREAYRHSKYAPKILHDNGIKVVMKTDHPAILSRYLLHEAQQAHYYGLSSAASLASVISNPAEVLGLDHRIGYIKEGYDADLVIWDSHPLTLGATPTQVFIDGISQISAPHKVDKPASAYVSPKTPNFDQEAEAALEYDGLPPLKGTETADLVIFTNLTSAWVRQGNKVRKLFEFRGLDSGDHGVVGIEAGEIVCMGEHECTGRSANAVSAGVVLRIINLERGSIQPGLVSFGSTLGLQEISMEPSTTDGSVLDHFEHLPEILGNHGVIRAVDGLQYHTRDALLAYRAGVTTAITPPIHKGFLSGLSVKFSLGAAHKLEKGAVVNDIVALHVGVRMDGGISTSTEIAALRRLLLGEIKGELGLYLKKASEGSIRLVVEVESADIMATLLRLKAEVDSKTNGTGLKLTFVGATESHVLAREIASAGVGVVVTPPRSFPYDWERRRIIPGPPLTPQDLVSYLISQGVIVGIGPQGIGFPTMNTWAAQNLRFDAGWIHSVSNGQLSKAQAFEIASSNIDILLGIDPDEHGEGDLVATRGGDLLGFEGKVVAVAQRRRGVVDLFL